jgi:hypothetical protein
MKAHILSLAAVAVMAGAALTLVSLPAAAQDGPAPSKARPGRVIRALGPPPRTASGKPDLSGVWNTDRPFVVDIAGALPKGETLPMNEWSLNVMKTRKSSDDPEATCLPTGVPRLAPYPMKYLQMDNVFVILFEGNIHTYRQIFLDRKTHPKDPNPTWYGDSIGHWEGDALVVDTVGYNDRFWFDFAGHPHTEQLHTIERFERPDKGRIDYTVTIDDPGAYTRKFNLTGHFPLIQNGDLMEYICNEDQKDAQHLIGFTPPTLTDGAGGANQIQQ